MKRMDLRMLGLLVLLALPVVQGCACHSTDANEVGVLTRKFTLVGSRGVQTETYAPGATYFFFPPFSTDWTTFETKLQNLRMQAKGADEKGRTDDIEFKTVDGNDIAVDVTVAWRIDPALAPHLVQKVARSTEDVESRLVRPATRALVRDALNVLRSEDFYTADKRFAAAENARKLLDDALKPEGVIVEQVILQEHRFNPEYEKVIREKKLAEQMAEKLKSEAQAAAEEAKRNLESAKGTVSQKIAQANGELEQAKLTADAELVRANNEATAILKEAEAKSKGIAKENEAMAGAGGRTMVKLRIAEALQGKQILFMPSGHGGASLQTMDMNQILTRYSASKVTQNASAANSGQ
ncbi:SPFH domain-containing protein [Archangium sp.]|jgi:regulator of protease activity HflC (stomatin/prohibitin superfamily)|uniref:SPFH domain-containing protein n=1 Tax=Archangium sp. TaxID=1872627 RepID=UPI003899A029